MSCFHIDRDVLELLSLSLLVLQQLPTWIPGHAGMSALTCQVRKFMWHICPTSLGLDPAPLLCVSVCLGKNVYMWEPPLQLHGCYLLCSSDSDLSFLCIYESEQNIPVLFSSQNCYLPMCTCVSPGCPCIQNLSLVWAVCVWNEVHCLRADIYQSRGYYIWGSF